MLNTLKNEKGIALVLSLMVLAALTLIGIAAIMTSSLEMNIAGNEKVAIQAQYASEAGIGEAIGRLNLDSADPKAIIPPTTPNPPWPISWANNKSSNYTNWQTGFRGTLGTTDGKAFYNYTVSIRFKPWVSGSTMVAFYNQTSGYTKADYTTGGQPVYQITAIGSSGNYKSKTSLEITRDQYTYQISGGLNANGPIDVRGSPTLDGNAHKADGTAGQGSCSTPSLTGSLPAVFANGTTEHHGGAGTTVTPSTVDSRYPPATPYSVLDPWSALGLTQAQFDAKFVRKDIDYGGAPAGDLWVGGSGVVSSANPNMYRYDANATNGIAGSGILVVHNPRFVPGVCGVGDPGYPDFTSNTSTDDCYELNAPAELNVSKGTFKGVVIADRVSLSGNVTIIGSVISLTTISTDATAAGNPSIIFSCEAIERFAGGKVKSKLAWNRLE